MVDPVWPAIRVRAVRGRIIDPFRGSLDVEQPERLASRSVEDQPLDDVIERLSALPNVKLTRAGRRFSLRRGGDTLKVSFASAARRVSLDDTAFEGDGMLAIAVLHALLPLFGAVEVYIGTYTDLIDGHEPLDTVSKRYDDWWIQDSLRVAKRLEARDAAARLAAAQPAPPVYPKRWSNRRIAVAAIACIVGLVAIAGGAIWVSAPKRAPLAAYCTKNEDCESRACLPREPVHSVQLDGVDLSTLSAPHVSDPSGVCTQSCATDGDCPSSMACGAVVRYGSLGFGHRASSCIPRAWQDDPTP